MLFAVSALPFRCTTPALANLSLLSSSSGKFQQQFNLSDDTAIITNTNCNCYITLPKVNRFGWNLELCEPTVGDWPWQILGAIRAVETVWKAIFVMRMTHDLTVFPWDKFYDIWTQRQSVSPCKLSEHNFEKFYHKGSFSKKRHNCSQNF